MGLPVVAIVGSPNVGKSTIFNRLIGDRHAIVDDEAGITRDRLYAQCTWLQHKFTLIDTGGIEMANRPFQEQIRIQAQIAIDEADVIVFVCDGQVGVTNDDMMVARMLRKVKKPIILAVNKIDEGLHAFDVHEFYSLGIGEPLIWGMSVPLKRPFIAASLGGFAGGTFIGCMGLFAKVAEGTGIQAALLINEPLLFVAGYAIAVVTGFLVQFLIGFKDTYEVKNEKTGQVKTVTVETSWIYRKYQERHLAHSKKK